METGFNDYINDQIREFLEKYKIELGYSKPDTLILSDNAAGSLMRLLVSVTPCPNDVYVLHTYLILTCSLNAETCQ